MIEKKNSRRFYGVLLATICATLGTMTAGAIWRNLTAAPALIVFGSLFMGFYFVGVWVNDRSAELNKKRPRGYSDRRGMGAQSDFIAEQFVPSESFKAQQRLMTETLNAARLTPENASNSSRVLTDSPSDESLNPLK